MRLVMTALIATVLFACTEAAPPVPPADHTYQTKGVVERLPARNDARVHILHEEIPDFVGVDGEVAPMRSMSMPFAVAEGIPVAGLAVGQKVAFTFEVRWSGGEPLLITELQTLSD